MPTLKKKESKPVHISGLIFLEQQKDKSHLGV